METMKIEYLLEILSEELWIKGEDWKKNRNPSLKERMDLVENLLKTLHIEGNQITFDGEGKECMDFIAYPYLLLEIVCDITNADPPEKISTYKVIGFEQFSDLDEYVYHGEFLDFSVFVKENGVYRKAESSFYIRNEKGGILYTDIWGYRFSWGYPEGNCEYKREPGFKHYFMLQGVAEFHSQKGIFCALVNSLDDLMQFMEGILCSMLEKNSTHEKEVMRGEVFYQREVYAYEIRIDQDGAGYQLFDKEGNPYCTARHSFVNPAFCEKIVNCQDCMEIFGLQTEILVMEEMLKTAKLE